MTHDVSPLAETLSTALSPMLAAPATPWLWQPLLRLLANGEPVTTADLAIATGHTAEDVHHALTQLRDTEYDQAGRVIGHGITQRPTPHRFTVDGRQTYTWCAVDTLAFPAILDQTAHVESPCHATETPIRLTVAPNAITDLNPATAVVSVVTPQHCTSVRTMFCNEVHFFATPDAAHGWLSQHPEGTVLPVADAFSLGRHLAQHLTAGNPSDRC